MPSTRRQTVRDARQAVDGRQPANKPTPPPPTCAASPGALAMGSDDFLDIMAALMFLIMDMSGLVSRHDTLEAQQLSGHQSYQTRPHHRGPLQQTLHLMLQPPQALKIRMMMTACPQQEPSPSTTISWPALCPIQAEGHL